MQQQKVFSASSYKEVEKKVDEWMAANPHVDIVSANPEERDDAEDPEQRFIMTVEYVGLEGRAE